MGKKQQPEALRLAEMLTADEWPGHATLVSYAQECITELLRQHAENETLRASHGQAPATQQAGATKEHVRLVRVIADKIEDGTLFRSGIYSNKDLARFVRNVADAAAPQHSTTAQSADSVLEDAADPLQGAANWLAEAHGQFSPVVLSGCLMIGYNRAKRLHDAALAARKQGEKQ